MPAAGVAPHRPEVTNAAILLADLQVDREAVRLEGFVPLQSRQSRSLVVMWDNAVGPERACQNGWTDSRV